MVMATAPTTIISEAIGNRQCGRRPAILRKMPVAGRGRTCVLVSLALGGVIATTAAQKPTPGVPTKPGPAVACAAELGAGLKTKRLFCDIVVAKDRTDSISITLPPHRGAATLSFDLHNRFGIPEAGTPPDRVYARHEAVVAVVAPGGALVDRLVVRGEFRGTDSLFDRIGGGSGPGGAKAIGPGPIESIKVTIPATLSAIGIVGVKLTVMTTRGTDVFDSPGRPVAIASNFKVEYTPK
jgi:hypothetical protein